MRSVGALMIVLALSGCRKQPRVGQPDDAGVKQRWRRGGAVAEGCRGQEPGWPPEDMPPDTTVSFSDRGGLRSSGLRVSGANLERLSQDGNDWTLVRPLSTEERRELTEVVAHARIQDLFPGYGPVEKGYDRGIVRLQIREQEEGEIRTLVSDGSWCLPPAALPVVQLLVRLEDQAR